MERVVHPERDVWTYWLVREIDTYADPKFNHLRPDHDVSMRHSGTGRDSYWFDQVMQYPVRADILGLDTPDGRQALMKGFAAYAAMVESMIRVYGVPPAPGYPSGEIHDEAAFYDTNGEEVADTP